MHNKLISILREKNILSLVTSLTVAMIGLFNFMLLTRSFEKEVFGDWVLFITMSTFMDMLRFGLTSNALIRFASSDDHEKRVRFLGASYKIGLFAVLFCALLLWSISVVTHVSGISISGGYRLFILFYPILALLNLSWNNSVSYFQARQKFEMVLLIRLLTTVPFFVFLLANLIFLKLDLFYVLMALLVSNLIPSILIFLKKWDGLSHIKKADKKAVSEMLSFGRFSMGTLIGTSLLKSADTVIIGLSPVLGSVGIALYAIPLKLIDFLSIPLRSFSVAAYPRMSLASNSGDITGLKKLFHTYSGAVSLLFIPVAIICFVFSKEMVLFLGGADYSDSVPLMVSVFRIFIVYSVILPLDRFTGVALDSINRPKFNFYKVVLMASANVVGNIIAVFVFGSLEAVALVTVLFTLMGIVAGYRYLNRFLSVSFHDVVKEGIWFYRDIGKNIRSIIG